MQPCSRIAATSLGIHDPRSCNLTPASRIPPIPSTL
uniref:Uncharacterized protein n=1 Tax=Arundo donax TaxID=35708 RepID=A0A0A9G877_ARUDO